MRKIKEVLRLKFANDRSIRQISKSCDIGRTTVSDCIGRAKKAGLTWPLPADLDDKAIEDLLYPSVKNGSLKKTLHAFHGTFAPRTEEEECYAAIALV